MVVRPGVHHVVVASGREYIAVQEGSCRAFHIGQAAACTAGSFGADPIEREACVLGRCDYVENGDYDPIAECHGLLVARDLDGTILDARLVPFANTLPSELDLGAGDESLFDLAQRVGAYRERFRYDAEKRSFVQIERIATTERRPSVAACWATVDRAVR